MFKFLGGETCAIQIYGKLPLAKDYLRIGAGGGSGQALRDWLDRSFSQGSNSTDPLSLPWPAALIVGESWGQPLCAGSWPSGDAGNLRPFPFTAFVERKKKALLEDLDRGLPVSSPVFDWLAEAYAARDSHGDGQSYLAAMRKRELAIGAIKPFDAERIEFDNWLSALWPDTGKDGLLECLRGLDALRRASYRGPLRLPLVTNLPIRPQVCAWFRLLVEMNLVARDSLPTLFFPLPAQGPPQPVPEPEKPAESDSESSEESSESSEESSTSYDSPPDPEPTPEAEESQPTEESSEAAEGSGESEPQAEEQASAVECEPTFLLVFRATPPPTEAVWVRLPDGKAARREGDFCGPRGSSAGMAEPAGEGAPPLADSLRGALAGMRGRLSR